MVAKRSTKMGKIVPYVDVRSNSDIPKFESMIKMGPVFVLVYADWCGHCQRFKQNMWDEMAKSNNKGVNTAAVHYDMVDKTSMKNATIDGYPTLFEVKPTPKSNVATPVSTPQSKEDLQKLLQPNIENNEVFTENNEKSMRMITNSTEAYENTFKPDPVESLPPNVTEDDEEPATNVGSAVRGGGHSGGSLFETLLKVSADSAHALVLAGSAMELSRRYKKRYTKRHRSSKKRLTKRR